MLQFSVYLFFATILTYVATGLAALSMAKTNLLSSRASKMYLCVSALGALAIILRGVAQPGRPTPDTHDRSQSKI